MTSCNVGEANPRARITAALVAEVREIYSRGGTSQALLARQLGISRQQVGRIIRGECWRPA